ncbi:MAG: Holliday junction resolvase RuvX [Armatimonadetes bacterium]|nr:Holliday junction resolvase RuvX [Armatimonadota bacterium]
MSSLGEKTVLAVDPGSSKCGMAVVFRSNAGRIDLVWRGVVPTEQLQTKIEQIAQEHPFSMVIVGSGTRSTETVGRIRETLPSVGILVVDERDTTMKARERYWEHNPRRGWRRLIPATLQTPKDPVDDFVALILAERVLSD